MSEAAPGIPDPPDFSTEARSRLAEASRRLIDAIITLSEVSDAEIDAAADSIRDVTLRLGGDVAPSGAGYRPSRPLDWLPRSPFVGKASPVSPPAEWEVRDGRVHVRVTFGAIYEGPPGYVHGGFIALAFDELFGLTNARLGQPGMTGTLSVKYRSPTPLHREVQLEAWIERMEGRRVITRGELRDGEKLCAEAEGLFIALRPEVAAAYFAGHEGA